MIKFEKETDKLLPYNRKKYIDFLIGEDKPSVKWFGISYQLPGIFEGKDIGLKRFIEVNQFFFNDIILQFDKNSCWIVNHDYIDDKWFPNNENNLTSLRTLFKENNIKNSFKGALMFSTNDLFIFCEDLISYPYAVINKEGRLYYNLDISHNKLPFIIKISGHLTIDIISQNKHLLKDVANAISSNILIAREYEGTNLLNH